MKIISKYKDFYDFLTQDHDADIIYNRKPEFITENILNKVINTNKFRDNIYRTIDPHVSINYIHFGIYPYVYLAPYIKIRINVLDRKDGNEFKYIFLNENMINSFKVREDIKEFAKKYTSLNITDDNYPSFYVAIKRNKNIPEYIKENYTGKIECKELFKYIKCPVFCEYNSNILDTVIYSHELDELYKADHHKYIDLKYIGNCCFNKLNKDILKYWINELMDLNTYINIENFLWSIKQEPISEPDNKTKIVNHGFDLKTSFRNM